MGLDEAEKIWNEMVEFFGDNLANPDHEPKRFTSQMKIFKHVRDINNGGHKPNE